MSALSTTATGPLAGQVALITGAARRIGATIARRLHAEGMDLVLHYRGSSEAAGSLQAQLQQTRADSVRLAQADLNDCAALPGLIEVVRGFRGRLDVLVNNASTFYPTPFASATLAEWDDLLGVNLKAPFFLTQAAAELLATSQGCVVNLVDIHGERPLAGHPIYAIAKAGNAMLVKTLARELGPRVRVNGVAPGAILWPEQGLSDAAKATILTRTALARPGDPADIAAAVLFLVRDAGYITGQIINVDGGRAVQQ